MKRRQERPSVGKQRITVERKEKRENISWRMSKRHWIAELSTKRAVLPTKLWRNIWAFFISSSDKQERKIQKGRREERVRKEKEIKQKIQCFPRKPLSTIKREKGVGKESIHIRKIAEESSRSCRMEKQCWKEETEPSRLYSIATPSFL